MIDLILSWYPALIALVTLAIITFQKKIRAVWKSKKYKTAPDADKPEEKKDSKDPHAASPAPQKSKMGTIGGGIGIIIGLLVAIYIAIHIWSFLFGAKNEPDISKYTPFSVDLCYGFEVHTEGQDTIYFKFPGVKEPVEYSENRGTVYFPDRTSGTTEVYSKNRQVKVNITFKK